MQTAVWKVFMVVGVKSVIIIIIIIIIIDVAIPGDRNVIQK
jgi:hypothetical protein